LSENGLLLYNKGDMVKIHLFSGFQSEHLGITRDTPLGHLYSDENTIELREAAKIVGVNDEYIQNSRGFFHYDLWGKPLLKARLFFPRANNHELCRDIRNVKNQ
jgi:hypothetical protein